MALIQEWSAAGADTNPTNPAVQSGPATTAGSGLFARAFIRSTGVTPGQVTLTDDAGTNTWTLVASEFYGSSFIYLFHAANADPITSVSFSYVDLATGSPYNEEAIVLLTEFSDVGALLDTSTAVIVGGGLPPALTPTGAGQLLIGVAGTNVSQSGVLLSTGITAIALESHNSGSSGINFQGGHGYTTDTTPASIGWDQTSGTEREYSFINALYADTSTPPPLTESGRYLLTATGWVSVTTTRL